MQATNFLTLISGGYVHHRYSSLHPSVTSYSLLRRHSYVPLRSHSTVRVCVIPSNSGSQEEPMDDNEYIKEALKWVTMSPLDEKYPKELEKLLRIFSEYGLFRYRTIVQAKWLLKQSDTPELKDVPKFSQDARAFLENIIDEFSACAESDMHEVENIEHINEKAVINFLMERSKYQSDEISQVLKNYQFTCTPEVINLAYGMMLKDAINIVMFPVMSNICETLSTIVFYGYSLQEKISNKISSLRQLAERARKIHISEQFKGEGGNDNPCIAGESNPNIVKDNVCLLYGIIIEFNTILTDIVYLKLMVKEGDLIDFERNINLLSPDPRFKALERNILSKTNPFVVDLVGLLGSSLVGYQGMLEDLKKL